MLTIAAVDEDDGSIEWAGRVSAGLVAITDALFASDGRLWIAANTGGAAVPTGADMVLMSLDPTLLRRRGMRKNVARDRALDARAPQHGKALGESRSRLCEQRNSRQRIWMQHQRGGADRLSSELSLRAFESASNPPTSPTTSN